MCRQHSPSASCQPGPGLQGERGPRSWCSVLPLGEVAGVPGLLTAGYHLTQQGGAPQSLSGRWTSWGRKGPARRGERGACPRVRGAGSHHLASASPAPQSPRDFRGTPPHLRESEETSSFTAGGGRLRPSQNSPKEPPATPGMPGNHARLSTEVTQLPGLGRSRGLEEASRRAVGHSSSKAWSTGATGEAAAQGVKEGGANEAGRDREHLSPGPRGLLPLRPRGPADRWPLRREGRILAAGAAPGHLPVVTTVPPREAQAEHGTPKGRAGLLPPRSQEQSADPEDSAKITGPGREGQAGPARAAGTRPQTQLEALADPGGDRAKEAKIRLLPALRREAPELPGRLRLGPGVSGEVVPSSLGDDGVAPPRDTQGLRDEHRRVCTGCRERPRTRGGLSLRGGQSRWAQWCRATGSQRAPGPPGERGGAGTSLSPGLHRGRSHHLPCVPRPFIGVQPEPWRKATDTQKMPRAEEGPALIPACLHACVVCKATPKPSTRASTHVHPWTVALTSPSAPSAEPPWQIWSSQRPLHQLTSGVLRQVGEPGFNAPPEPPPQPACPRSLQATGPRRSGGLGHASEPCRRGPWGLEAPGIPPAQEETESRDLVPANEELSGREVSRTRPSGTEPVAALSRTHRVGSRMRAQRAVCMRNCQGSFWRSQPRPPGTTQASAADGQMDGQCRLPGLLAGHAWPPASSPACLGVTPGARPDAVTRPRGPSAFPAFVSDDWAGGRGLCLPEGPQASPCHRQNEVGEGKAEGATRVGSDPAAGHPAPGPAPRASLAQPPALASDLHGEFREVVRQVRTLSEAALPGTRAQAGPEPSPGRGARQQRQAAPEAPQDWLWECYSAHLTEEKTEAPGAEKEPVGSRADQGLLTLEAVLDHAGLQRGGWESRLALGGKLGPRGGGPSAPGSTATPSTVAAAWGAHLPRDPSRQPPAPSARAGPAQKAPPLIG
ncbi:collagen alpha-1(I) chain-like [Hippopotamus amphibius kiboko]|uniref:collagen alpha-1(I) chain-like n=1 Tax=Hippopotamus amphibius kiboko TaxID=575201 RepID=UPI002595330C|nr:collagen alpha-1(I) chain-like [Hippopotamus amphibius kiboko]